MILDRILSSKPSAVLGQGGDSWLVDTLGGSSSQSGVRVNESTALSYSAVYAAVRVIAETIATVSWHVMERRDAGKFVADEHPVDFLIHRQPNEEVCAVDWRSAMMVAAIMYGNAYAEIIRSRSGAVTAIGPPIHPTRVTPKRRERGGELFYEVAADQQQSRPAAKIGHRDMFHLRGLGGDGLMGYFLVKLAAESIGHAVATDRFGSSFFGNGAHAGGWIKHEKNLSLDARKRLRDKIEQIHQGVLNSHRVGVLDEGMDWVQSTLAPDQAQFLQTRTFNISEVSRWTGVPPHMLAEMSRSTFNNVEQQSIALIRYAIRPWAVRAEAEADRKLFNDSERGRLFTKLNLKGLQRGDIKTQGEFYRLMTRIGVFSINDVRQLEDLNPIGEGGDLRLVEMNLIPIDAIGTDADPRTRNASRGRAAGQVGQVGQTPPPQDTTPALADVESAKRSLCEPIADCAARLVEIECERWAKAIKKHGSVDALDAWSRDFYRHHQDYAAERMAPMVTSLAAMVAGRSPANLISFKDAESSVTDFLRHHLEMSRAEMLEAADNDNHEDLMTLWRASRPPQMTESITEAVAEAVIVANGDKNHD